MTSLIRVLVVLVVSLFASRAAWAEPLPTDPSLTTGQLDNGLRYVVKRHAVPPGHATIWIHIHSGSLNESDRQRGLAHYLEHMAFNGSANFPPGSLVPFFQSMGMTFGRDQNAFTNFEQTTYQLTLPNTSPDTLTKGMTFFADVVGRLSLLPKEIDEERQIIQEERRRGLSGRQRTGFYVLEHMAPGSLYGERITIGKEETINAVREQDFKDYYGTWYGASNATLMVVADTDPAEVVKCINAAFASLPKRERPVPQDAGIKAYGKSFAIVASDPEVRSEEVRILRVEKARPPVTTVEAFRADLVSTIAEQAFRRRTDAKESAGTTHYSSASLSLGNDAGVLYSAEISGRAKPGMWRETLGEIALELQRARAFGFTAREIDDVKKAMIANAERGVETEPTSPAQGLIARMNSEVAAGEPMMSRSQRLDLLRRLLPTVTPDEVGATLAKDFSTDAVAFIAVLPSGGAVPTEAELLDLGTKALAATPIRDTNADADKPAATALMTDLPKPGAIAESAEHAPTQVWSAWLSNNVRVHVRTMDDRKNEVSVSIDLLGGEMLETADNRGITSAATLAWSRAATRRLSSTDIRELMTGRKISVRGGGFGGGGGGRGGGGRRGGGGGGSADSVSLSISGSPDELETGFQLAHLLLTEPKIEEAAFDQQRTMAKQMLAESQSNPMMFGMRTSAAAIYPESEARLQPPTAEQIDRVTLPAAQAWLEKLLRESPIEVVVVGDVPRDKVMDLVTRYIGSLPARDRVSPTSYAALRKVSRPTGPRVVERTVDTPTEQAFVMSGFYGADQANLGDARALSLAARILSTRMVKEVREEAQLVYSIGAQSRAATTYPGFGTFSAGAPTEPAKAAPLVAKLASMYEAFAKAGPSEEEMAVAKKQIANTRSEEIRDPAFWSRRLQQLEFRGGSLDEIISEPGAYEAMSGDQVRAVFAKYYTPQNTLTVVVKPAGGGSTSDDAKPVMK